MKDQNETRRIALYVAAKIKPDYSYGSQVFEYTIVTVDKDGKVRNCSDSDDFCADYDDLTFRCQVSRNINDCKPFAFSCEYRGIFALNLRRAERCVKMLRKIDKASEKFPVRPATFGQYVSLMARALGVTDVVQVSSNGQRESSWHDETPYVTWKLSDCQWLVDRQIDEFLEEHGERIKAVAA